MPVIGGLSDSVLSSNFMEDVYLTCWLNRGGVSVRQHTHAGRDIARQLSDVLTFQPNAIFQNALQLDLVFRALGGVRQYFAVR